MSEPVHRPFWASTPAAAGPPGRRAKAQLLRVTVFFLTVTALCFTAVAVHAMCIPHGHHGQATTGATLPHTASHAAAAAHSLSAAPDTGQDVAHRGGAACLTSSCHQAVPGDAPSVAMLCLAFLPGVVLSLVGLLKRPGPLAAWRWLARAPDSPSWPGHLPPPRPLALPMLGILRT